MRLGVLFIQEEVFKWELALGGGAANKSSLEDLSKQKEDLKFYEKVGPLRTIREHAVNLCLVGWPIE